MYLRCPKCKNSSRFDPSTVEVLATCGACGRVYLLEKLWQLGATASERSERAIEYAKSEGIDLASAYTVLLGIVSLEEARAFEAEAARSTPGERSPRVAGSLSGKVIHFDPGFREAVEAGHLTARQAMERGDRVRWASKLSQKHGITMEDAFLVTDAKTSLASVFGSAVASGSQRVEAATVTGTATHRRAWPAVVLVIVGLALWGMTRDRRTAASDATRAPQAATAEASTPIVSDREIRANAAGQVTSVTAATPEAVLEVYCRSTRAVDQREPVRVELTKNGWRGIFSEAGAYYGIHMRKEPGSGRVTAGDGRLPLLPELVAIPRGTT